MNKLVYNKPEHDLLADCTLCPRQCGADRFKGADGYCNTGSGLNIASICIHRGEEPPVSGPSGICNIFFSGCNLKCIFCQNHDISQPCKQLKNRYDDLETVLDQVESILLTGVRAVGFVSPSHVVPQVKLIIKGLNDRGLKPITVYNTNSYDLPATLREMEGMIDVYLPDMKYATASLANEFSDAADYPAVALRALKEMYYQKGSALHINGSGIAENGILIRHLVLPGHTEESRLILRLIAEELSPGVSISLMSQYHPAFRAKNHLDLNRPLYIEEYRSVIEEMERLGFRNGWLQDQESNANYLPDFSRDHPFE